MDNLLFSAGSWLFRVSVFSVLFSVSLSAFFLVFYHAGTRGEENFPSRLEVLGYGSQMDEEQLSSWPWIISVLASVEGYCCIAIPIV